MKQVFWTSVFWIALATGFLAYLKWFDTTYIGANFAHYVISFPPTTISNELPALETTTTITNTGTMAKEKGNTLTGSISQVQDTIITPMTTDQKLDAIQTQLKDISEKLDIQNSNSPDAVNIALKTTKRTNIWVFPLDGSNYKKYILQPSEDILRETLNLLFEKTAFSLNDSRLDADGNLTIELTRVPGSSFGGSAAVAQARTAIEKTALQFTQIKKVIITPDTVLQP